MVIIQQACLWAYLRPFFSSPSGWHQNQKKKKGKKFIKADLLRIICDILCQKKDIKCNMNIQIVKEKGASLVFLEKEEKKKWARSCEAVNELFCWRGFTVAVLSGSEGSRVSRGTLHDSLHIIRPTIERSSNLWRGEGWLSRWRARFASLPRLSVSVPLVSLFITPALGLILSLIFDSEKV